MKKISLTAFLALCIISVKAQNIQTHYDFGDGREMVTTTIEMFKADDHGNTFFFIDFDYGGKSANVNGVSLSYFEIAREFQFWNNPFAIHAEYNSGMFRTSDFAAPINSAFLFGGSYTFANTDFSKMFKVLLMYKYIDEKADYSAQLTTVWGFHLLNGKVSFTGFTDFWKEDNLVFDDQGNTFESEYVFLTEPQIWYNLSDQLSVGGEVEISTNFAGHKGMMTNPTLGVKWVF